MKRFLIPVLFGFACPCSAGVLEVIAKEAIVVAPDQPSAVERQCAERIAAELARHGQDKVAALQAAGKVAAGRTGDARHHLIVVGNAGSQFLLRDGRRTTSRCSSTGGGRFAATWATWSVTVIHTRSIASGRTDFFRSSASPD